jgi:hypothetical protein
LALAFVSTFTLQFSTFAQGTAFTYQGRLNDTGQLANGIYDLRFTIFDSTNLPGTIIAGPITNSATGVSNGLFTVTLDFGSGVFTGPARWLQIDARTNGGASFNPLSPRQDLTPAPYTIFAASSSNLVGVVPSSGLSGGYSGVVNFANPTNQFFGTFNSSGPGVGFTGNGAGLFNVNAGLLNGLAPSNFWQTAGNAATTAGPSFLGTTDNQPLELHVNGARALRLEPNTNGPNVIGGTVANAVAAGVGAATIGGGDSNSIRSNSGGSTIAGGLENTIQPNSDYSFIGGGSGHVIGPNAVQATIAGGYGNSIQFNAPYSVVAGGLINTINSNANISFIGGGNINSIGGDAGASFLGGGQYNGIGEEAGFSTLGGGQSNSVQFLAAFSTLSGGFFNTIGTNAEFCTIAGGRANSIQPDSFYSAIGGGSNNAVQANASFSTVGGGASNTIQTDASGSIIAGGQNSTIQTGSTNCAIGGGFANNIRPNAFACTIAGGDFNAILSNAVASVIGGGLNNTVSGAEAVVPGGFDNFALGDYSLAAGNHANAVYPGCFVWADSSSSLFLTSTRTNQFLLRAAGGVGLGTTNTPDSGLSLGFNTHLNDNPLYLRAGTDHNHGLAYCGPGVTNFSSTNFPDGPILWGYSGGALGTVAPALSGDLAHGHVQLSWTSTSVTVFGTFNNMSDRDAKQDFQPVNSALILEKVAQLPITEWRYKSDAATPHIGPVAQDFHALFQVGTDDRHIAPIDEGGVALAAIQALNQRLAEKDAEIKVLNRRLETLEELLQPKTARKAPPPPGPSPGSGD